MDVLPELFHVILKRAAVFPINESTLIAIGAAVNVAVLCRLQTIVHEQSPTHIVRLAYGHWGLEYCCHVLSTGKKKKK